VAAYTAAVALVGAKHAALVSSLQQVRLLQVVGVSVPAPIHEILRPPTVVAFVGHMLDRRDRVSPRFPVHLETRVREAIDHELERLNAGIGYCSLANGSDILFAEALQDRDAR